MHSDENIQNLSIFTPTLNPIPETLYPSPPPTAMKIFISYNHKDSDAGETITSYLREASFEVIRDTDEMRTGEKIEDFIARAVSETDIILWLASLNSLKSGWVTHEFAYAAQLRQTGRFWTLQVQERLFELDLFGAVYPELATQLEKLKKQREARGNAPTVDLDPQIKRLQDAMHHLPERLQFLGERLTLDVSGYNFHAGMKKLVVDLEKWRGGVIIGGGDSKPSENMLDKDELKKMVTQSKYGDVFAKIPEKYRNHLFYTLKNEWEYQNYKEPAFSQRVTSFINGLPGK